MKVNEETIIERAKKTGHVGVARDELVAERNAASGKPLCDYCDGTGNEFYFMYRACPQCDGTGLAKTSPSQSNGDATGPTGQPKGNSEGQPPHPVADPPHSTGPGNSTPRNSA